MKKLFTLFALLAMVLSASAKEVVDIEIDFSKVSEIKFYGWGASNSARERLSLQDGCLHFHSEAATDPTWDCQFHPIGGVAAEEEVVYTLHYKVKGDHNENISALGFGQTPYGQFPITTEWVEGTFEYTCAAGGGGDILMQCGGYVGDFDIAYLKITHDEQESATPTEWKENLVNGDAEGEFGEIACVQSKIFDTDEEKRQEIFPSEIIDEGGNKVFVTHSKAVNPPLLWAEDGEQWGTQHSAGDPMPDNAWQNQMWIVFPRAMKDGEVYTLKFKYKASKAAKVSTQTHNLPGAYLGGGQVGELSFTTSWQTFEKKITAASEQSIAFNLGQEFYDQDIDFYLDDVSMQTMVLEEGYFVAGINNGDPLAKYDYQNAIKFEYDEDEDAMKAVIGTMGDKSSWVNEVMVSTVRGDDKQFQVNTLKLPKMPTNDPEDWGKYTSVSKSKIKLPAAGVWQILIDEAFTQMNFIKLEGEEDKEPVEIKANPNEIVIKTVERDWLPSKKDADGNETGEPQDGEEGIGTGQPWDNQFFLIANRDLAVGEEVFVAFDYMATAPATVGTQNSRNAGNYLHWAGLGNIEFTTEWKHFENTITIPKETADNGPQNSWTFNLSNAKAANEFHIKNIIFCNADKDETFIDMVEENPDNFQAKVGANTAPMATVGIKEIKTNKVTTNAIYNLAGQRVSKDYKGIAIKNGVKYIVK